MGVFEQADFDVLVCSYESAARVNGQFFRIKFVEEPVVRAATSRHLSRIYDTDVKRGVNATYVVHFAPSESDAAQAAQSQDSDDDPRQRSDPEYSLFGWFLRPYTMMWKAFIRPPRATYADKDLGNTSFVYGNHVYEREDVELTSSQGHNLACSHFYMRGGEAMRKLCVVYLHGNCFSRLEAFYVLPPLLARGLSVFCLDLAGSGRSGGEYISLGHYEEQDIKVVLEYLREVTGVTAIGLWGRSMGAAAAVLRAAEDPDLAACVLDSPFSDLRTVVEEYVDSMRLQIPKILIQTCLKQVRVEIQSLAGFDPFEVKPVRCAHTASCPALFAVATDDNFVLPHHTFDLHNVWGGERRLSQFTGGHSGRRPAWFMDEAADFLVDRLHSVSPKSRPGPSSPYKRRVFVL